MGWSSYPPEHKRSFFRAVGLYLGIVCAVAAWAGFRAGQSRQEWQERVPLATAEIRNVYDTPGLTEAAPSFSNDNTVTPPGEGEGYIGLVMTDEGISETATQRAFDDLPAPVALAFSPYAVNLQDWLKKASGAGRETLLLLPMESADYPLDDPGPHALLSRLSAEENKTHLDLLLSQAAGTIGAMNFMGEGFLGDDRNTGPVFQALRDHNALFVENPPDATPLSADAARSLELPYLAADARIDARATDLQIRSRLHDLELLSRKRGWALGIAQPYPITFTVLNDWAAGLNRRGFKLVPLSQILKTKVKHEKAAAAQQQPQQQEPAPQ
jgi:polysaccharide deacetylase 2 family uncharacterized protein YibQ